jgi:N-acetylmuramoyl-L-alanine amidase
VLKPALILICLLLALAGCSTAPRRAGNPPAPDWNLVEKTNPPPMELEHVAEGPQVARPSDALPEPFTPRATSRGETWIPFARWSREHGAGALREIALVPAPVYSLKTANGVLVLQIKSLIARWNGLEFHLGFEPVLIGGQPFVHTLDLEKNIKPLLRQFEIPARTNRVLVIDPGHGGKNTGTESVFGNANEKEFTLDWARRLARLLTTNGWQVFLTRTNDADVSLSNRVAFAEERRADLFISLHFNSSAPNHEQAGLETYCLTPAGMPSTLKRGYEDDTSLAFANNNFDGDNFLFAVRLHRSLVKATGELDRGVRRARFLAVLRGQNRPAVLIEGGYLSNPREARRIADPVFREQLAETVAQALVEKSEAGSRKPEFGGQESQTSAPKQISELRANKIPPP